ncbi:hypothetical protein PSTG_00013 [Puccinia striiformis f. sp. tritici PST-78]|uniref:RING-type domain-containing protein n=1 Tax=Puccinia striiformis f. sp. tritici PST-78 TaxID=1165861 RepID=A0A0L0W5E2_9BASI|nr:hypothetical protein PSTG_00013 [Puccinia striiformis f. sp. tritici PST-78]
MRLNFLVVLTQWGIFVQLLSVEVLGMFTCFKEPKGTSRWSRVSTGASRSNSLLENSKEELMITRATDLEISETGHPQNLQTHFVEGVEETASAGDRGEGATKSERLKSECEICRKKLRANQQIVKLLPCDDRFHSTCIMSRLSSGTLVIDANMPCPVCQGTIARHKVYPPQEPLPR